MDKAQFWRLIEDAKEKSGGDCEEQVELVTKALAKLPPEEIIAFDRIMDDLRDEAYRWDLWGAAYLINGGASDDGFEYFRCWLIAQGQVTFEKAVQDPDSLADVIESDSDDLDCESPLYIGMNAYKKKTRRELPIDTAYQASRRREPVGVKWEEDDLDAMFPKIVAKINVEE